VSEFVVADASLAFKWLVKEENSDKATDIARFWNGQGLRLAAPCFMPTEVTNILHRRVVRGELTIAAAADLVRGLLSLGIELHETPDLHTRALELASRLNQGAAYDAHYLALAETLGCELWTADQRFQRAADTIARNVRWLGEFVAPE
jgi:predicted nucleic acid-binding protein